MTRYIFKTAVLTVIALFSAGCVQNPQIEIADKDTLESLLSGLILGPLVTCEELRDGFELQYLPVVQDPGAINVEYQEHYLVTADNEVLRLWYLPTQLSRGVVVLSQGAVGTAACYLFTGRMLRNNGWTVVMWDYRGFGPSSGTPSLGALRTDLEQVVDWARDFSGHDQVSLMGISLGSVPSVAVAVARPEAVNAVILDSPLALGDTLTRFDFILDNPQTLIDLLDPELVSERIIDQLHQPLLVLQGERDIITPPPTVLDLYSRAGGPKQLVTFPTIGHAAAPFRDTGDYTSAVEGFLSQVWGQALNFPIMVGAEGATITSE